MMQEVGCAGVLIAVPGECHDSGAGLVLVRQHKRQRCEGGKAEHDAGHGVPVLLRPQYEQDITHRCRNRSSKGEGHNGLPHDGDTDIFISSDQDAGKETNIKNPLRRRLEPIGWKLEDFFRNTESLQTQYYRSRRKDLSALSRSADAITSDDDE